ncbi:hypothetical protein B0T36_22935 [Nocardia donostiensis]|uniref:DUF3558 domain-containing protein n=1 Tax=Nocardia donostiensis TaxID=1538463 RepID=UPI0009F01018|nr:DUF3558 domain-containing protein [Nocardia donostiensis]OQS12820.1 hypothetical protein B0T36_22935 [Nocardia donostiensis]
MRTVHALRATIAAAAVMAAAAGCGTTVNGEPAAEGAGSTTVRDLDKIEVFNPCKQLSDEVLRSTGMDPASKSVVTDPPSGPSSWRVCRWEPEDQQYLMYVFSTSHTLDEARKNENLTDLQEVTVGPRPGLSSRPKSDTERETCHIAFAAEQGMFEVHTAWLRQGKRDVNICAIAMKHAVDLEPHLPK